MVLKMSAADKRRALDAIQRAENAECTAETVTEAMTALRPIIGSALNAGSKLSQIEKLLQAGNPDRARRMVEQTAGEFKGVVYFAVFFGGPILLALLAWLYATLRGS